MKIIYFIGGVKASGAEKRLLMTAIGMSSYGLNTTVVIRKSLYNDFLLRGYDISRLNFMIVNDIGRTGISKTLYLFSLFLCNMKILFCHDFDICHTAIFSPFHTISGLKSKKSFIFEVTSPDVAISKVTYIAAKLIRSLKLISVSESVDNRLKESGIKEISDILLRNYPYVEPRNDNCNESLLVDKVNTVVYAHRLIERKNPIKAARVFLSVANKFPNWNFEIYGSGPLENTVENMVHSSQNKNISFLGRSNDLSKKLARSKIFVSLISPDNYPSQSVLEAIYLKNFVVLSDTGQSKEKFIFNESNGLVTSLDEKDIESSLIEAINQVDHSAAQLLEASQKYTYEYYINDNMRLYEQFK
ncbi:MULTISPECIES: glycosyltransferase [unclassified Vibrio]|uniref:glycosyltransferase n=1 Tax=unclassified Vibrio TaxID=2614977 RepID=UPI00354D1572